SPHPRAVEAEGRPIVQWSGPKCDPRAWHFPLRPRAWRPRRLPRLLLRTHTRSTVTKSVPKTPSPWRDSWSSLGALTTGSNLRGDSAAHGISRSVNAPLVGRKIEVRPIFR